MSTALELTIVVPAYNESLRLGDGLARFRGAVADGAVDVDRTEVVVVDDGSTDDTSDRAHELLADLPHHRVIRLPDNRGKGGAVRAGVTAARGRYTAYMDADMAIDPRAIPLLLEALQHADIAIGSRALADSMVESRYVLRSLMGRLFNRLVTFGTDLHLDDTQCGFKAFRTPVARLLFHLVRIDRFAFDVEILARARKLGLSIAQIPVQWKHVPGSSIQPLRDSVTMLTDVYRSRLGVPGPPPVTAVAVRDPSGRYGARAMADRASGTLARLLPGVPVPVVTTGDTALVLLPLVEAGPAAAVAAGLSDDLRPTGGPTEPVVTSRTLTTTSLGNLGPLSGRLVAPGPR